MKQPVIYVLANQRNGKLYIGVTSNLIKRVFLHKNGFLDGFTDKHKTHMLVYYEIHQSMKNAINRENQLNNWNRKWKVYLIEKFNPNWDDLYKSLL